MKPVSIGAMAEAVKAGYPTVKYQVEIVNALVWTFGNSSFVHVLVNGAEFSEYVENPTLAEAIRERCDKEKKP